MRVLFPLKGVRTLGILSDLKMYSRFAWGLRGFLKHTLTLEEAKAIIKRRMEERETNFLRLVRKGIFGYPKSPYLPLMKMARCEMGDIEDMVRNKGLEDTLRALREAGVYITFEESKGREPIVRNGKVFPVKAHDFDNPFLNHYYQGTTGGTTGAGTRVDTDLDYIADRAPDIMVGRSAHDILNKPTAIWRGILPDSTGLIAALTLARYGNIPDKWFIPITSREFKPPLKHHLAAQTTLMMGRLFGVSLPRPEPVPLDQAIIISRWIAETLKTDSACLIGTNVSLALRVCIAAREQGLNLKGTTFTGAGEPPTTTKVNIINSMGACYVPNYSTVETLYVGTGCAQPTDCNDIHLYKDALALIQYPREVPGSEVIVNAFHFTTLLLTAPKLMLNVESDDYGIIENRSCGCPLEAYGFTDHLRHIQSFRKLTSEGVTLIGSEMIRILEEVLPSRFGGSPLDYQLTEEEDENGFTRLCLSVSPKVQIADESKVIEAVLGAMEQSSMAANLARAFWGQAKTLRIKRMEPIWTARGKFMPLHLTRSFEK
jgi:hypothetical protein